MKKKPISLVLETDATLKNLYDFFITRKQALNLSKDTIIFYQGCIARFSGFMPDTELASSINQNIYFDYIDYLKKDNLREESINSYLRGMRAIFYFGMENGFIKQTKLKLIKVDKTVKETYTNQELVLLLKKPDLKKSSFSEYRNWVIINYLLATGTRLRNLLELKISDIDFANGIITLRHTKSRKTQQIPISEALEPILKEYLTYRKGNEDDVVFCNSFGEMLERHNLAKYMKQYHNARGVKRSSIHLYRHTFAKNFILNGGDVVSLKLILGHSSLEVVQQYVNLLCGDIQPTFSSHNPLDNLMKQGSKKGGKIKLR